MVETPGTGEWVWAVPIGMAVQVQSTRTLWGTTTFVAIDGEGRVHELNLDDVQPFDAVASRLVQPSVLTYIAAGARLAHHLSQPQTLTAPFRSGLQPLPHQIKHLEDALSRETTRLLLADEVGLGKTITAGLILTELKQRGVADRILVLTPAGLVPQWIEEMRQHFNLYLTPLFTDLMPTPETGRVWTQYDHVITGYDAVKPITKRRGWTRERIHAYNENRFDALLDAAWDVVVIDEAHRVAGATPGVARNALAAGVSMIAPHLLLLTGTPHQGKIDHFHRLVQFLDPDTFATPETITPQNLGRHLLRTEKRNAVTLEGEPLFLSRTTELWALPRSARSDLHHRLYDEATEYIRTGYAAAEKDTRSGLGFLMILVQRLLASSTTALEGTLRTRLEFLRQDNVETEEPEEEEFEDPDADIHEEAVQARSFGTTVEIAMLNGLLVFIQECQREGPDPKAIYLLELIRTLQQREADPTTKFLVFTEFTGTQCMLAAFLQRHGYSVATLNGSMGIDERLDAQKQFRGPAQVMVSTEAGGEGLNLQFCHLVVNYDLPWNPMRIEQRIGRVHRIGQKHPVFAYNLVLAGTVEHRVVEILGQKLERIVHQLGIDKLSDVLDTPAIDADVQRVYRDALRIGESELDREIEELAERIRAQAERARAEGSLRSAPLDLEAIRRRLAEPVPYWLEQFAKHAPGRLPPDLRQKETRTALQQLGRWIPGSPLPCVLLTEQPAGLKGTWSLWRVGLRDGNGANTAHYHPILVEEQSPRAGPAAQEVWDVIIAGTFEIDDEMDQHQVNGLVTASERVALDVCRAVYESTLDVHRARCEEDERRHTDSVKARRNAIRTVGLPEVRQHRLKKLETEDEVWKAKHELRKRVYPIFEPMLFLEVRGGRP